MFVNVTLTFRKIVASEYTDSLHRAYAARDAELQTLLLSVGVASFEDFAALARVAKEADGTYTITLP